MGADRQNQPRRSSKYSHAVKAARLRERVIKTENRLSGKDLVDLIGIEPMTSSMPWKRAPNCATGPLEGNNSSIVSALDQFVNSQSIPKGSTRWEL